MMAHPFLVNPVLSEGTSVLLVARRRFSEKAPGSHGVEVGSPLYDYCLAHCKVGGKSRMSCVGTVPMVVRDPLHGFTLDSVDAVVSERLSVLGYRCRHSKFTDGIEHTGYSSRVPAISGWSARCVGDAGKPIARQYL
jgi:hypothetical protein